jgi:hypothetical protein
MFELCAAHASLRLLANKELLEQLYYEYGQPASDAFMDKELALGAQAAAAGFSGIYTAVLNAWSMVHHGNVTRQVLPPASVALVEACYPRAMFLRHALHHEAALGCSAIAGA